jgi:hypothetical protein
MADHDDNRPIIDTGYLHGRNSPSGVGGPSRREFLTTLAAFGVSAILPGAALLAQASPAGTKPRLIDLHHHIFPPAFLAITQDQFQKSLELSQWTPQKALAEMDENGVATSIASITGPGIWFGDVQSARTLARKCNDYLAQLVRDHPGRVGFLPQYRSPTRKAACGRSSTLSTCSRRTESV